MIRILHVVGCLERGGTEAFIMNLYRHIDRSAIQFDFLVLHEKDYPYLEEIRSLGGNVYFDTGKKKNGIPFIKRCVAIMKQYPYAAVHSHLNVTNGRILLAARLAKIPLRISHSHDTHGRGGNPVKRMIRGAECRLIRSCATDILACGMEAGEYLYGKKYFHKKGQIINNGISIEPFLETYDPPADIDISTPHTAVFGNISRFEEKKNSLFLLDVFSEICKLEPEALLLLGGTDGGMLDACIQKVTALGLQDRVRFVGVRKDMPQLLHTIDVFLFPSLYEGLPFVLLEAQASGCSCIASTGCSPASDMGLDLIRYVPLEEGAEAWARYALEAYRAGTHATTSEATRNAFAEHGYDIASTVARMTAIYTKNT